MNRSKSMTSFLFPGFCLDFLIFYLLQDDPRTASEMLCYP